MSVLLLVRILVSVMYIKWDVSKEIHVKQGYVRAYLSIEKNLWPERVPGTQLCISQYNGSIFRTTWSLQWLCSSNSCWQWKLITAQVNRSVTVTDTTEAQRWRFDAHPALCGHFSSPFIQIPSWKAETMSQRTEAPYRATSLREQGDWAGLSNACRNSFDGVTWTTPWTSSDSILT